MALYGEAMHISRDHKFCYYAVPFTKSTSTRRWLERYYGAVRWKNTHSMQTPPGCEGYCHVATVRNPVDRALSSWRRIHQGPVKRKLKANQEFPSCFEEWMEMLVAGVSYGSGPNDPVMFKSQSYHLSQIKHLTHLLRFESIPQALHHLPFVTKPVTSFPHLSKNTVQMQVTWADVVTPRTARLLVEWAGEDFEWYREAWL